jgi:hypothetical protein
MPKPTGRGNHKADRAANNQRSRDLDVFSRAVHLFNAQKFEEAKELFQQVAGNSGGSLADAARSRVLICERRMRAN